jgi:hypothetical protein
MRSESGINSLHSLNTSGVHAARCCAVPCADAGAAKPGAMIKVAIAIRLLSFIVVSSGDRRAASDHATGFARGGPAPYLNSWVISTI